MTKPQLKWFVGILVVALSSPSLAANPRRNLVVENYRDGGPRGASYRWLDGARGDITGLRLKGFDITVERGGVRIDRNASNVVIRDGAFRLRQPTRGSNLPVAVEVISGSDILIENVSAHDFRMESVAGKYTNGDCFSGERKSSNVTLRNAQAIGCSDGGFDFKTDGLLLDDVSAEDVNFCYRIWGQARATTLSCRNWRKGAVQVQPGGSLSVDLIQLSAKQGTLPTVFGVGRGATLIVGRCEGLPQAGKLLFYQQGAGPENTTVRLGPGCQRP
ncbi:hypothetical protein [Caulobacter hibisci]|uniref:Right handed beta helix domain-containing protein n=1 Tax=Caulobacter hibisci TaxID=2035993 RepID=A0ABS0T546_9CAUL|nr:hypothetical protein [Caulobacter hibisci]MBI1687002.1 hypothetical protein [Caulobacter hibisci]